MENNDAIVVPNVTLDQLPKIISNTYSDISSIDEKIKSAINKAGEAKKLADDASKKNAGWSFWGDDKKEAIEALQKSNLSLANALSDNVEANNMLFDNQKKMAKGLSYLYSLGIMNIAANRTVVRELEMKLRHASQEELSDLARQEIMNVILQLRAQEDMQYKIDKIEENIREMNDRLNCISSDIDVSKSYCNSIIDEVKRQKENMQRVDLKVSHFTECQEIKICTLEKFKEEEIARRSLFTSKIYSVIITLIAIVSLIISILR